MSFNSTAQLRNKEVINICNGARLGCPEDFEFDICGGRIIAIIVCGDGGALGFGRRDEYIIPWNKIECIGEETILVKLSPDELRCAMREQGKRHKNKQNL